MRCAGGCIGIGQEPDQPDPIRAFRRDDHRIGGAGRAGPGGARRGGSAQGAARVGRLRVPAAAHRAHASQDRRAAPHRKRNAGGGSASGPEHAGRDAGRGRPGRSGDQAQALSAPAFGRRAPAADDRLRHRASPETADRRRAGVRARCASACRDHGTTDAVAARDRHGAAAGQPRSRLARTSCRPGTGDAGRPGGGGWRGAGHRTRATARLQSGALGGDAQPEGRATRRPACAGRAAGRGARPHRAFCREWPFHAARDRRRCGGPDCASGRGGGADRRLGLGQIDHRSRGRRAGAGERRGDPVAGHAAARAPQSRAAADDPAGIPGPGCQPRSALARVRHHRRTLGASASRPDELGPRRAGQEGAADG